MIEPDRVPVGRSPDVVYLGGLSGDVRHCPAMYVTGIRRAEAAGADVLRG